LRGCSGEGLQACVSTALWRGEWMLAGRGASPPSLPVASHASQSPAQAAARQHGCPTPGSSALRLRRSWNPAAQRRRPSRNDSQHACGRERGPRRSSCQTAATLTAEPSTAGRAPAAAARGPDADRGHAGDSGNSGSSSGGTRTEHPRLPQHDPDRTNRVDLVVAGGGPAGLAVAERVSAAGYQARDLEEQQPADLGVVLGTAHTTQPALAAHRCLLSAATCTTAG